MRGCKKCSTQQQQQQQRQQQIVSPPPPPRSSATSSASDTAPTTTTTTTTTTAFATANGGSPAAPPTTTSSDETSTLSAIPPSESNVLEDGTPLPQTPGITPSTSDSKSTNTGTGKELPTAPSSSSSSLADTAVVAVGGDDSSIGSGSGVFTSYYDRAHRLWSDRSGMSEIYELKQSVDTAGASYDLASAEVTKNRRDLDGALRKWETASGQHLQLLQRRESWTADDAQRFADFVALEITSRAELEQAKHVLARSEEALTRAQLDYINKMRRRYHEEQIWQDQWRVLGTYGTWSLIVLNSCVFLGSQYFQRRRERERMDTIAQLIAENNNNNNSSSNNNHHDNGAAAMNPKQAEQRLVVGETSDMQTSAVDVEKLTDQDAIATKDDQSNHHEQEKTKEEKTSTDSPTIFTTDESLEAELTERSHSEGDTAGKVGQEPNNHNDDSNIYRGVERVGNAVGSVGAAVSQWEHRVRSDAKELALSVHQKLSKALPPNVASKMPKSVSDIDVPSAIIGASVGGITVLTVSLIISSFSGRRQ
eukprot:jgi/Psemu1/323981/estExt_fgenesh1_pg.C_1080021